MSDQPAMELKRTKSRARPSSKFVIPGITGRVRCLAKKKRGRKYGAKKDEKKRLCCSGSKKEIDFQQVIRDIRKDRKRADVGRKLAICLKRDLEEQRIHSFQDIQDRLDYHINANTEETKLYDASDNDNKESYSVKHDSASATTLSDPNNVEESCMAENESASATAMSDSSNDDGKEHFSIEVTMSDSTKGEIETPSTRKTTMCKTSEEDIGEIYLTKATTSGSSDDAVEKSFLTKSTMSSSYDTFDSYDSVEGPGDHLMAIASSSSDFHIYEDESISASELSVPDLDSLHIMTGHSISMNALEYSKAWTRCSKKKSLCESVPYRRGPQKYFSTSVAYHSTFGSFHPETK